MTPPQRYHVRGTYYVANGADDGIAEVRGTCLAGHAHGAMRLVAQVIAFGEEFQAIPQDLEVYDDAGALAASWAGGMLVPVERRSG